MHEKLKGKVITMYNVVAFRELRGSQQISVTCSHQTYFSDRRITHVLSLSTSSDKVTTEVSVQCPVVRFWRCFVHLKDVQNKNNLGLHQACAFIGGLLKINSLL